VNDTPDRVPRLAPTQAIHGLLPGEIANISRDVKTGRQIREPSAFSTRFPRLILELSSVHEAMNQAAKSADLAVRNNTGGLIAVPNLCTGNLKKRCVSYTYFVLVSRVTQFPPVGIENQC
jgi:hypothetical protein